MSTQTVIDGVAPPPPPKRTAEMIKEAVLAYIAVKSMSRWGNANEVASDITSVWRPGMDGYELAKCLDAACYWDCTLEDAEYLDGIGLVVRDAEEQARKAWAMAWDIKPPFQLGTRLTKGVIHDVSKYDAATYRVKEHGCTQDGHYLLVRFEDAIAEGGAA